MKKIKALFVIDRNVNMATRDVEPTSQWVIDDNAIATIKYDGTPALIKDGVLYKRWNRKIQKKHLRFWKADKKGFVPSLDMFVDVPNGAIQLEEKPAPISLHFPYWLPVDFNDKADKKFASAFELLDVKEDGTYELIGEGIQGNVYELEGNKLVRHGSEAVKIQDYTFDGLKKFFSTLNAEGIVWHHPKDGRMVKLRRSHFNFEWREDIRDDKEARASFVP